MNTISDDVTLGDGVVFGQYCVVEDGVRIGSGCTIGNHVVIRRGTTIGENVRIDDHTSIGKQPMKSPNSAVTKSQQPKPASIGSGAIIGSNVVIYAGSDIGPSVLVADMASIREDVSIGTQTIVGRGVAIENQCTIGKKCKLETNAYITAYSEIGDYVFVAPGVLTSNDNYVGRSEERFKHFKGVVVRRGGRLAVGSIILPGTVIHEDGLVAAGAVATRDVESKDIVVGVPAKRVRSVDESQLLDNQTWFGALDE